MALDPETVVGGFFTIVILIVVLVVIYNKKKGSSSSSTSSSLDPSHSKPVTPVGSYLKPPEDDDSSLGRLRVGSSYSTPTKPTTGTTTKPEARDRNHHTMDRIRFYDSVKGVWICRKCESQNSMVDTRCKICSEIRK